MNFFDFRCPSIHPPSTIHHPPPPSVKTSWLSPGTPEGWNTGAAYWEKSFSDSKYSTCKTRHSTCKTRHSTCKTRYSTCKTRGRMVPPRVLPITLRFVKMITLQKWRYHKAYSYVKYTPTTPNSKLSPPQPSPTQKAFEYCWLQTTMAKY